MVSEMGLLGSPSTTSYRLLIATIGLSLTVSQCSGCYRQTGRQMEGIGMAIGGSMH